MKKTLIKVLGLIVCLLLIGCTEEQLKTRYTVEWIGFNDVMIEKKIYNEGSKLDYPTPPTIEGYTFIGWDKTIKKASENVVIKAIYEINTYTIKFVDINNDLILEQKLTYKQKIIYPEEPTIPGYEFIGWDKDVKYATKDLTIKAEYIKLTYNIKFYGINGKLIDTLNLSYGSPIYYPTPPQVDGYQFVKWDNELEFVEGDAVINAIYTRIEFEYTNYSSYVEDLTLDDPQDITDFISKIDYLNDLIGELDGIIYGKFRGENELHAYDVSNYRSRNSYGHEIAINKNGVVIASSTLVDLPTDGLIISGHGKAGDSLNSNVKVGDYVIYDKENGTIKIYRSEKVQRIVTAYERMKSAKTKIIDAYNSYKALDYQKLNLKYLASLDTLNKIISDGYQDGLMKTLELLVVELHYLAIESNVIETKAFWHYATRATGYPEKTTSEVCNFLDKVSEIGINTIYLNTNFGGACLYTSQYLKNRTTGTYTYEGYKDYLECFITEAHKRNIRVVAWTNTFICGDGYLPNYINKDYVAIDYNGKNNYNGMYFYDITRSEVKTLLNCVFDELAANYDLDGIEFDFIRYPASNLLSFTDTITDITKLNDFCYTDSSINLFKGKYNITGDVKTLMLNDENIRKLWQEFKVNNVTEMVKMLSSTIKKANPNTKVSAAVMTSISGAIKTYAQDFLSWVEEGYVDCLEPMMYVGSNSYLMARLASFVELINGKADIVVGISPDNNGGDVITLSDQIAIVLNYLNLGFSEFSSKNIFKNEEILLGLSSCKKDYTKTQLATKDEIKKAYLKKLLDCLTNYYQYVDKSIDMATFKEAINEAYYDTNNFSKLVLLINEIQNENIKNKLLAEYNNIARTIGE